MADQQTGPPSKAYKSFTPSDSITMATTTNHPLTLCSWIPATEYSCWRDWKMRAWMNLHSSTLIYIVKVLTKKASKMPNGSKSHLHEVVDASNNLGFVGDDLVALELGKLGQMKKKKNTGSQNIIYMNLKSLLSQHCWQKEAPQKKSISVYTLAWSSVLTFSATWRAVSSTLFSQVHPPGTVISVCFTQYSYRSKPFLLYLRYLIKKKKKTKKLINTLRVQLFSTNCFEFLKSFSS